MKVDIWFFIFLSLPAYRFNAWLFHILLSASSNQNSKKIIVEYKWNWAKSSTDFSLVTNLKKEIHQHFSRMFRSHCNIMIYYFFYCQKTCTKTLVYNLGIEWVNINIRALTLLLIVVYFNNRESCFHVINLSHFTLLLLLYKAFYMDYSCTWVMLVYHAKNLRAFTLRLMKNI